MLPSVGQALTIESIKAALGAYAGVIDFIEVTGDGANNKAAAHNLGVVPKFVFGTSQLTPTYRDSRQGGTFWHTVDHNGTHYQDIVTAPTDTNIYLGAAINFNGAAVRVVVIA